VRRLYKSFGVKGLIIILRFFRGFPQLLPQVPGQQFRTVIGPIHFKLFQVHY
jgi:hypothetical protein